jgi:hypothetical protein
MSEDGLVELVISEEQADLDGSDDFPDPVGKAAETILKYIAERRLTSGSVRLTFEGGDLAAESWNVAERPYAPMGVCLSGGLPMVPMDYLIGKFGGYSVSGVVQEGDTIGFEFDDDI